MFADSSLARRLPAPVEHGGPSSDLWPGGRRPAVRLDFSVNVNPLGASPTVRAAIADVDPSRYPDPDCVELRRELSSYLGANFDHIVIGNGATELIYLIAELAVDRGDRAIVVGPTYGEYAAAISRAGGEPVEWRVTDEHRFEVDVRALARQVSQVRPRAVFICNPNNPTGAAVRIDELRYLLATCGDALLVVDEAFVHFSAGVESTVGRIDDDRLVVLGALTKSHGLAGLRLGYAVCAAPMAHTLWRAKQPWSVSAVAQAAGIAALRDREHVERGLGEALAARDFLAREFGAMGVDCVVKAAPWMLARVGDAAGWTHALGNMGIAVRSCVSFGLPAHIRLGPRPLDECEALIDAMRARCGPGSTTLQYPVPERW
jgi:histidinol-phosphate aminotransferase